MGWAVFVRDLTRLPSSLLLGIGSWLAMIAYVIVVYVFVLGEIADLDRTVSIWFVLPPACALAVALAYVALWLGRQRRVAAFVRRVDDGVVSRLVQAAGNAEEIRRQQLISRRQTVDRLVRFNDRQQLTASIREVADRLCAMARRGTQVFEAHALNRRETKDEFLAVVERTLVLRLVAEGLLRGPYWLLEQIPDVIAAGDMQASALEWDLDREVRKILGSIRDGVAKELNKDLDALTASQKEAVLNELLDPEAQGALDELAKSTNLSGSVRQGSGRVAGQLV